MDELIEAILGDYTIWHYIAFVIIGLITQLFVKAGFYWKMSNAVKADTGVSTKFNPGHWFNDNIVDVARAFILNVTGGFLLLRFTNDIVNFLVSKVGIELPEIVEVMFYSVLLGIAIQRWLHKRDQKVTLEDLLSKIKK